MTMRPIHVATLALWLAGLGTSCGSEPGDGRCRVDADCADGDLCTTGACGVDGTCVYQDVVCDDGAFCNGLEACSPISGCMPGTPPLVDDGIDCTADSCDEDADLVRHTPDDGVCADGIFCNGVEVCDTVVGCRQGEPAGDGIGCTNDACDEASQTVVSTPDDGRCDDGLFCNGVERCDPVADCVAGTPPGDGIGCTNDLCDESTHAVMSVPDDGLCDDGDECTTSDVCDPVLDCVHVADVDPACGTCDNCGFETGDFTSWDTRDIDAPFDPLRVEVTGGGGGLGLFFTVAPTEGTRAAYTGFDGAGPGTIEVGQDIDIHPSVPSATLTFDYRVGWDLTFGAMLPRTFEVQVEPAGGGTPLQNDVIVTANPSETVADTGNLIGTVDLTDYIGETVYVRFVWDVPEANTGPAVFQLDNIAVVTP